MCDAKSPCAMVRAWRASCLDVHQNSGWVAGLPTGSLVNGRRLKQRRRMTPQQ